MNETDDDHTKSVWEAYQSSGINYTDELIKSIYESKLNASGLLQDSEINRIAAEVKHEKLLNELLGEAPVAVTSPLRNTQSIGRILRGNKLSGKSATSIIMDDPWDI